MQAFNQALAEAYYKLFWEECGTKGLTVEQKVDVLCKLRDLSLRQPYWLLKENDKINKKTLTQLFPELIPSNLCNKHTHLSRLSGLLLYTMHMLIFKEVKAKAEHGLLTKEQIKQLKAF